LYISGISFIILPMKQKTKSYVVEFPLRASDKDVRTVDTRMKAAGNLYNALLSDGFCGIKQLLADSERQTALDEYRTTRKKINEKGFKPTSIKGLEIKKQLKAASGTLSTLDKKYGFREYDFHRNAGKHAKACWIGDHLDSNSLQTIATRAFKALQRWQMKGFGSKGKPRFKTWRNGMRSIQGKSKACMRIKLGDDKKPTRFIWKNLELPIILSKSDKHGYEASALDAIQAGEWKFCRIIRKNKQGSHKLYLQVIMQGDAYIKPKHRALYAQNKGRNVGVDIGPSTIAAVGQDQALLDVFCGSIEDLNEQIGRLQRQNSRRLRLANPDNYTHFQKRIGKHTETRYRVKKGSRNWEKSNQYLKTQAEIKELHRKMADKRKYLHECLANKVLGMGNVIFAEKLSYLAFQKMFGKSIGFRAPSMFMTILARKAEKADGRIVAINTWTAKLSQYDHVMNTYTKKPLSQRHHQVGGQEEVQRDLYSAFLAKCVKPDAKSVCQREATKAWPSTRPVLEATMTDLINNRVRSSMPSSLGIKGQRLSSLKSDRALQEACNDPLLREIEVYQYQEPSPYAPA
jgi:putative transposase